MIIFGGAFLLLSSMFWILLFLCLHGKLKKNRQMIKSIFASLVASIKYDPFGAVESKAIYSDPVIPLRDTKSIGEVGGLS